MGMKKLIRRELSTTQLITLGFFVAILTGALLLMLPCSSADGTVTPFADCLFTSATSVCVTGLVVVTTATHWCFQTLSSAILNTENIHLGCNNKFSIDHNCQLPFELSSS